MRGAPGRVKLQAKNPPRGEPQPVVCRLPVDQERVIRAAS